MVRRTFSLVCGLTCGLLSYMVEPHENRTCKLSTRYDAGLIAGRR